MRMPYASEIAEKEANAINADVTQMRGESNFLLWRLETVLGTFPPAQER